MSPIPASIVPARRNRGLADSGLYFYGYRYLDTQLGRWLSRDPIGELGGVNLYGFVGNDPISETDILGLACGFTVRRFTGPAGHQWLHDAANNASVGLYPGGPDGQVVWRDENDNNTPGRPSPDDPNNYYEWETNRRKTGKLPSGVKCCVATCDQIAACLAEQVTNCPTTPKFRGLTGNCRKRSEQALENCCLKKGKMTNKPASGTNPINRAIRDTRGGADWISDG